MWRLFRQVLEEALISVRLSLRVLNEVMSLLDMVRSFLWGAVVVPDGFGPRVQVRQELIGMATFYKYKQDLLPVKPGTTQQRLSVSIDGVAGTDIMLPADATSTEFTVGPEGASVLLSLDYLDARGNDSANFEDTFIVVDGIGPAVPDGFGTRTQIEEVEV